MRGSIVMDTNEMAASTWQHRVLSFLALALLAVVCIALPTVSVAGCYPHCKPVRPSLYGDPRCGPRDLVAQPLSTPFPSVEMKALRCDFREPRRHAGPPAVAATPQTPSPPVPAAWHVGVPGANETGTGASGQQSRSGFDRDVGFNDGFGTRADEFHAAPRAPAGAGGLGGGAGGVGLGAGGLGPGAGGVARGRP